MNAKFPELKILKGVAKAIVSFSIRATDDQSEFHLHPATMGADMDPSHKTPEPSPVTDLNKGINTSSPLKHLNLPVVSHNAELARRTIPGLCEKSQKKLCGNFSGKLGRT
jgi:hypothetical protein